MIALDCQPYSVVDDRGFKALAHALEPKKIQGTFEKKCSAHEARKIKRKLEVMQYVSSTTDIWSLDVHSDSLLSVTAHWIADNWQPLTTALP